MGSTNVKDLGVYCLLRGYRYSIRTRRVLQLSREDLLPQSVKAITQVLVLLIYAITQWEMIIILALAD